MKKCKLIYTCFLSLISFSMFSQPCLPEGIEFTTQSQIDNFQNNYPGCSEIEGDVEIDGNDISNLDGLNILTFIGGDFIIRDNDLLNSLTGLDNLYYVGGKLQISSNDSLINLDGLDGITSIEGELYISSNDILSSLTGLLNLTTIGGNLSIRGTYYVGVGGNNNLMNLAGLENLISIGGDLEIINNEALNNLTAIEDLDPGSIENIKIVGNDQLSECHVQSICDYLAAPNGIVEIHENATGCNNPGEIALVCGYSIPCLPYGNYYFLSQSDIDNFQTYFPGCSDLEGDVRIHGNTFPSLITNLEGLVAITSIGGRLRIDWNDYLTSLSGLNNLSVIGEDTEIYGNDVLTNMIGLEGLENIKGSLMIGWWNGENPSLINLTGLDNLDSIGGYFQIDCNPLLSNIAGLNDLEYIGGSLIIGTEPYGYGNPSLITLTGLNNMDYIGEDLKIVNNEFLTSLTGLEGLVNIGGNLIIKNNDTLPSLVGMDNLMTIGGSLRIYENGNLSSVAGLGSLASIEGSLLIGGTPTSGPNALTNLIGLGNLNSVGEDFVIHYSNTLTSLSGLNNLTTIGGSVSISGNDTLNNLEGFESLSSIGGSLNIGAYGQGGLLLGNQNLESLTGFQNLTSIGDDLVILANDALTSLSGLENINAGSIQGLEVLFNDSLSICHIESICNYLSALNGTVNIHDNSTGCNSPEEVQVACDSIQTNVPVFNQESSFTISPNPCSGTVYVQYKVDNPQMVNCDLYDISGIRIKELISEVKSYGIYEKKIDLSGLKPGVYFCTLKTNEGKQTIKIIKL